MRRLRVPGYVILTLTFLLPFIDLIIGNQPLHPGLVQWRFQTLSMLANALTAPIFILVMIYALGLAAGDRKAVVIVAVIAALLTVVVIASAGTFVLDGLQMKRRVQASLMPRFDSAFMSTLIKYAAFAPALLIFAVSAFRTSRMERVIPGADREKEGSLLVGVRPEKRRSSPSVPAMSSVGASNADMQALEPAVDTAAADAGIAMGDVPTRAAPKSGGTRPSVGSFPPPPRKGGDA